MIVLRLLQIRDCWDRSIIEHAIVSGRHAIFDAVFEIIRRDVYDEEVRTGGIDSRLGAKAAGLTVKPIATCLFHRWETHSCRVTGKETTVLQIVYM